MKILLIYFTGTFNTRFLTDKIEEKFIERKDTVERLEIKIDSKPIDTFNYDLIGFGYPIYALNSPQPFNKYIKKLKFKHNQKYFIYKDSGETFKINNSSSRIIKRCFKHYKMTFLGEYHYIMPYNIRFPFDKSFIQELLEYDEKLLDIMFYNLDNNIIHNIKGNIISQISSRALSIQKPGAKLNSYFYSIDNDKCIKCLKCIENCPNHNIILKNDKIVFKHNCNMCMRCSFFCPTNAIKIGILNNWKVNHYYDLNNINPKETNYIDKNSKGFYKCFIKTFEEIDETYKEINNKKER